MQKVFKRTSLLTDTPFHYCPGCTHGISHRLTAEAIEEVMGARGVIGVAPVGCAVFAYNYFNCDIQQAAHGRAPAVATGIKRVCPDKIVFAYQGDGDLASIGMAETVHAAARGENITVIFINNAIYGMTGGQMAPTTLIGQKSTTSQTGRSAVLQGNPIRVSEMLATLDGAAFVARVSLHDLRNVMNAKKTIKKAFEYQLKNKGFSLVEVLSTCPTNWGMTPEASMNYVKNEMTKVYPLGIFKEAEL
ncbi:MAG: 2-oxoglutarate oxidoreductase [Clostridiales bacterium]|jgi:2-oxoglutarate ferredoxin oxidoreductase subunit beta|nr:2-oxoglutarate oxidoreductase [Clostridiales bacterium]